MVHSSEQQTRMVSAAEFDTLCVHETAIVGHGGATETVSLNDKSTQAAALPGSSLLGMPHPLPLLSTMHIFFRCLMRVLT